MKVCKFGGSSLANAKQFEKIKKIIENDPSRHVIVVSAVGKDEHSQHKITDLLYLVHAHLLYGVSFEALLESILERYQSIEKELACNLHLKEEVLNISNSWNLKTTVDEVVYLGEYLSAKLIASYLNLPFVDAIECIYLNHDGSILEDKTYHSIQEKYKTLGHFVMPGFYGNFEGNHKLLPRGGSDITGALCAAALGAEVYENFSDVSGILMADPRIVSHARSIDVLSFAELRELTFMGASVLHEASVHPIRAKNIPLNIRNTNAPNHPGTLIVKDVVDEKDFKHFITGISGLKDFSVLSFYKEHISKSSEIIIEIFKTFNEENIEISLISKGIDSVSLTVKTEQLLNKKTRILENIQKNLSIERIDTEDELSLIACVGRKMKLKPGIAGQIFSALGKSNINIRTIAQGTEEISIIVGVDTKDFEDGIRVLYEAFIE